MQNWAQNILAGFQNGHWIVWVLIVLVTLIYENWFEWVTHKHILHGLGRNRQSFWSFHWIDHHSTVRRNGFIDSDYKEIPMTRWNAQTKEIVALLGSGVCHLPILWISPLAYATLAFCGFRYYHVHRKSHLDPEWAKKKLAWHYDHHMGADQNLNWCVTRPWFDYILGTRKKYPAKPAQQQSRTVISL
jgi:sterol desaturase/sphingolipid hydroxylase (fatty acid hydroxylase superfamily)